MATDRTLRGLSLTYRGRVLLLLALLCSFATWISENDSNVRVAASLLLAPFVIDLLIGGFGLPKLRCSMPRQRTQAGVPFRETVTVVNASRYRSIRDLHLREPRTDTYAGGVFLNLLGPGERATLSFPARARQRGVYESRVVVATSIQPFGILQRSTVLHLATEMLCEPSRVPAPASIDAMLEREQAAARPLASDHAEFHYLREYVYGDDARHVHALRSAATGTLVRQVLVAHSAPEATLILDLRRPPGRTEVGGSKRLEWSLSIAASIVDRTRELGIVLHVVAIDDELRHWRVDDHEAALAVLAYLATARAQRHRPLAAETLGQFSQPIPRFWIPAGGFTASEDRHHIEALLVTEWAE